MRKSSVFMWTAVAFSINVELSDLRYFASERSIRPLELASLSYHLRNNRAARRTMPYAEIPSDDEVVTALAQLGGHATAAALCEELVKANHPRRDSQLAIQRASERGRVVVASDWSLRLPEEALAA